MLQNFGTTSKKSRPGPLQLFVYDSRRGNCEGVEEEKILSFYPSSTPNDDQLVAVGLSQALSTFISTFDEDLSSQTLETDNRRWCSKKFETGVWVGTIVDCDWGPGKTGRSCLNVLLGEVYGWIKLLHGSVNVLLDEDPTSQTARMKLQAILDEWGGILVAPKSKVKKAFQNSLGVARFGAVPLLPLPEGGLLAAQYISNALQEAHPVVGVCFCHERYLLWSTLDRRSTKLVYSYSCRRNPAGIVKDGAQPVRLEMDGAETALWMVHIQIGSLLTIVLLNASTESPQTLYNPLRDVVLERSDVILQSAVQQFARLEAFHISGYRYVYLDLSADFGCASPEKKVRDLSKKTVQMLQHLQDTYFVGEGDLGDYEIVAKGEHKGWVVVRGGGHRVLCVALDQLQEASMEQIEDHIAKLSDTNFPGAFDM